MRLTRSTTILSITSIIASIIGVLVGIVQLVGRNYVIGVIVIISAILFYAFTLCFIELVENVLKIRKKLYHEDEE